MKIYLVWEEEGNSGYQSLCGIYDSKDKATKAMEELVNRFKDHKYKYYEYSYHTSEGEVQ